MQLYTLLLRKITILYTVLNKICEVLDLTPADILIYEPDKKEITWELTKKMEDGTLKEWYEKKDFINQFLKQLLKKMLKITWIFLKHWQICENSIKL